MGFIIGNCMDDSRGKRWKGVQAEHQCQVHREHVSHNSGTGYGLLAPSEDKNVALQQKLDEIYTHSSDDTHLCHQVQTDD